MASPSPSITSWTRIEPKPRDATFATTLQAQVRDPLWMLARQWQVGEFMGEDAGSPVQATLSVADRSLSTYRPGNDPAATVALDPALPLEVHVEREPVVLKLRAAVQLGLAFEQRLRAAGVGNAIVTIFRNTYPIVELVTRMLFTMVATARCSGCLRRDVSSMV